jgi:Flp pilus assembly protein protease CpaA
MRLIRFLLRACLVILGALLGLGLFVFAVLTFGVLLLVSLLTCRRPNLQFRMNRNPWAPRRATAAEDVVDIDAREVDDGVRAPAPLPLQPPRR